jgi:pimeloyl-[acyl-carrier protein] methyl ester esterase
MPSNKGNRVTCVFVHGWAMNSAVWNQLVSKLPEWIDVICIDLPGHGTMSSVEADGIDDYVRVLAAISNRPLVWVGWSLGGLAVLQLARYYPEKIAGLFLVATNPCFVRNNEWPCAVDGEVFEAFRESLQTNVEATVKRFLAIQARGGDEARKTVRELQQALIDRGMPSFEALGCGLDVLAHTDLRQDITLLDCPVSWYLGGRDTLVPVVLSKALKTLKADINITIDNESAHAPFISHPDQFIDTLVTFADSLR